MSNVVTVEKSMTDGERRVAQALGTQVSSKDKTLLWWHEPTLRDLRNGGDRVPDFVIFDDAFGLFVLEVKDWAIDQIVIAELQQWSVRKGGITRSETAPAEQARGASHILRTLMEADTRLIQAGGAHQGKAKFPVSYGAILPNITRAEASSRRLLDVHRGQHYFYKDDLESKSPVVSFMTVLRRTSSRFLQFLLSMYHCLRHWRM